MGRTNDTDCPGSGQGYGIGLLAWPSYRVAGAGSDDGGGVNGASVQAVDASGDDRAFAIVAASKGALGTAYLLTQPMPARCGADAIHAMPSATAEGREPGPP